MPNTVKPVRVSFDIGGVLSKQPDIWRPIFNALLAYPGVDVFVLSDMKPHEKAVAFCHENGFFAPEWNIVCCDYDKHGEMCKAIACHSLGIDVHIDDFPGYVAEGPLVRLLVMPDPHNPYYHDSWKTDGSEGNFGRRHA